MGMLLASVPLALAFSVPVVLLTTRIVFFADSGSA